MANEPRGRLGLLAAMAGLIGTAMCVADLDTARTPTPHGTVGQEVFRIVCERVDVGESPGDADFAIARPACTGTASAMGDGGATMLSNVGPKVRTLALRRDAVANAIDRTIPMGLYDDMDALLVNLLPLYGTDNGTDAGVVRLVDGGTAPAEDLLPQTTRATSRLLTAIADDVNATAALGALSQHQGYRPPTVALGLMRSLLAYPQIGSVLEHTLALIRLPGTSLPAGPAADHWAAVLDTLRGELGTAAPASSSDLANGTTLDATLDLLFRSDPALGTSLPRYVVHRDPYGMARVTTDASGQFPTPFVDTNPSDGFADSAHGRYVDVNGQPIASVSPFPANEALDGMRDVAGRAVQTDGTTPVYAYLDLDQTVLAQLMRDSRGLLDPANSTALQFARGASVLFGARTPTTRNYMLQHACGTGRAYNSQCAVPDVAYTSFDPTQPAPMVDLVHALGTALTSPHIDSILATVRALFADHPQVMARSMGAMLAINDVSKLHPEAVMAAQSNIWDDIMAIATQIAQQPGLLEDVLTALRDPATTQLGPAFAAFLEHRDRIEPTWTAAAQNDSLASATLTVPVDRTRPDTLDPTGGVMDNRSVFQRFLHLLHDLDGVPICNKEGATLTFTVLGLNITYPQTFHQCELIHIPDAAVFYLQAIAGTAHIDLMASGLLGFITRLPGTSGTLDSVIESQSGITGFNAHPTPEAIDRLVFQPDALRTTFIRNMLDPVQTRDGIDVRTFHGGTLFALELYNVYNAIRPLVQAFDAHAGADHDFVSLLSALHLHYATSAAGQYQSTDPTGALYSTLEGAERYEPIMASAFEGDFLASTQGLMTTLPTIDLGGGQTGTDGVLALARMVLDPSALPNLAYRDGRTTTVRSDGTTPVTAPNLYYLFADGFNAMDTAFATAPPQLTAWQTARSALVDTFLAVDGTGATAQFHNVHIPTVSRLAIEWVQSRVAAHRALGDEDPWARGLSARFATTVSGPVFSTTYDLLMDVSNDAPTQNAVGGLLTHLMDDSAPQFDNAFGTSLIALGDMVQTLPDDTDIDPLVRALAPGFQRHLPTTTGMFTEEEVIPTVVRFLDRARTYDTHHVLDTVLANLVTRPASPLLADEPIVVVGDAIAEVHRRTPGSGGALGPGDFHDVFHQVSDFFSDSSRGMEEFYYIVQHRRL